MKFIQKNSLLILVCIGVIIRLLYAYLMQDVLLESDAGYYVEHAQDIVAGNSFKPEWPPGLSYWLGGFSLLLGDHLFSYVCAMLVLYLIFSLFLYKGLRVFFDKKWALVAVAFFSLSPTFIHHSVTPLTQLPIAVCVIGGFYFLVKEDKGWKIGLCLALAILTRAGSLTMLPIVLGYLLYQKRYTSLPGFLAVLLILISSWQYKSYHMTDRWIWINDFNSFNFYLGNNEHTPEYKTWWLGSHDERSNPEFSDYYTELDSLQALPIAERSAAYSATAWSFIRKEPGIFLLRSFNRFRTFFAFDTYTGATLLPENRTLGLICLILDGGMFVLLGLGFVLGMGCKISISRRNKILLVSLILAYSAPYLLAFSHPTYHFPLSPLMAFFAIGFLQKNTGKEVFTRKFYLTHFLLLFFLFIQIEWIWHMLDRLR